MIVEGKLSLQKSTKEHFEDYYEIRAEKKNLYWTGYEKISDKDAFYSHYKKRISDPYQALYMLYSENTCLGALNLYYKEEYTLIGYSIKTEAEGNGYATLMVKWAEKLIKGSQHIQKLAAWINSENLASIKVCTNNGFHHSGITENRNRFGKVELYQLMIKNI